MSLALVMDESAVNTTPAAKVIKLVPVALKAPSNANEVLLTVSKLMLLLIVILLPLAV